MKNEGTIRIQNARKTCFLKFDRKHPIKNHFSKSAMEIVLWHVLDSRFNSVVLKFFDAVKFSLLEFFFWFFDFEDLFIETDCEHTCKEMMEKGIKKGNEDFFTFSKHMKMKHEDISTFPKEDHLNLRRKRNFSSRKENLWKSSLLLEFFFWFFDFEDLFIETDCEHTCKEMTEKGIKKGNEHFFTFSKHMKIKHEDISTFPKEEHLNLRRKRNFLTSRKEKEDLKFWAFGNHHSALFWHSLSSPSMIRLFPASDGYLSSPSMILSLLQAWSIIFLLHLSHLSQRRTFKYEKEEKFHLCQRRTFKSEKEEKFSYIKKREGRFKILSLWKSS